MLKRRAPASLFLLVAATIVAARVFAEPAPVPENLTLPHQNVTLFKAYATGTQIYTCQARANEPSTFDWTLKAPDAELSNEAGEKIGRHYAGPTWQAIDGSKVVGEAVERAAAPTPDAIPWLLLRAKASEGTGVFSTVTYVQRLETVGGVAPAEGCDQTTAGTELTVPYQATYAFAYGAA
jgi:Protein of unknown function (DUF3455)